MLDCVDRASQDVIKHVAGGSGESAQLVDSLNVIKANVSANSALLKNLLEVSTPYICLTKVILIDFNGDAKKFLIDVFNDLELRN